jgi:5-(carboxyamino)imidazole ribonucleotide mutase
MKATVKAAAQVGIIMGSVSDWKTLETTATILEEFGVAYEKNVVSAHRTPQWLAEYATGAKDRGLQVIIAGAGGAAHLPGMAAAFTTLPVLGIPVESRALKGLDSLLSIAQMPAGVPVGALAIGEPGAKNAALLAISILALQDEALRQRWEAFRLKQTQTVRAQKLPSIVSRKK